MSSGRLFQSFGPAEENERSPTVTRRDGRTSSWLEVADRTDDDETASQQRGEEGQTGIEVQCSIAVVHILSRFSTTILIAVNRKHDFDLLTASDLDFGSRLLKI